MNDWQRISCLGGKHTCYSTKTMPAYFASMRLRLTKVTSPTWQKNWVTFASDFSFRPQAPEKRPENRRKTAKF